MQHPDSQAVEPRPVSVVRATVAGLCASLVGIGLARFAYTPLIPALIGAGWFSPAQAAYLGSANFAGYLAGALMGRRMLAFLSAAGLLRLMMALATAAFFACAWPWSFAWFMAWRFAAGVAGGVLMVIAAPTVLPHIPAARKGLASGAIFTGVGLGIAASGTLVPWLLRAGLVWTWIGLGILCLGLTALAWGFWPTRPPPPVLSPVIAAAGQPAGGVLPPGRARAPQLQPLLLALYAAYFLNAFGTVPHMVFLVDYVARGLGRGLEAGALAWTTFGLGAILGPLLAGNLADRIGFGAALRFAFGLQAATLLALLFAHGPVALGIESMILGAFVPGSVAIVLGRVHELIPRDIPGQQAAWTMATASFALGQALAAYLFSFLFARGSGYEWLFGLGVGALLCALGVDVLAARLDARPDARKIRAVLAKD